VRTYFVSVVGIFISIVPTVTVAVSQVLVHVKHQPFVILDHRVQGELRRSNPVGRIRPLAATNTQIPSLNTILHRRDIKWHGASSFISPSQRWRDEQNNLNTSILHAALQLNVLLSKCNWKYDLHLLLGSDSVYIVGVYIYLLLVSIQFINSLECLHLIWVDW